MYQSFKMMKQAKNKTTNETNTLSKPTILAAP